MDNGKKGGFDDFDGLTKGGGIFFKNSCNFTKFLVVRDFPFFTFFFKKQVKYSALSMKLRKLCENGDFLPKIPPKGQKFHKFSLTSPKGGLNFCGWVWYPP